jgi:hypothetical protein
VNPLPTVVSAEVLTVRLTVSPAALAQAVEDSGVPDLQLVSGDVTEVLRGASRLSFRAQEAGLLTAELTLADDLQGAFTFRFLAPLFQRHRGDLHLKLKWEGEGAFRELRIVEGRAGALPLGPSQPAPTVPALTSAEEREVRRLLDEGRRHWEEYQRLKAEASKDDSL